MTITDETLIEAIKAGNQNAFRKLVETYQGLVANTCYGLLQNASDAEDVSQEVFIQVYRSIHKFRGDSKFSTWMYRVALNTAISLYRKSTRRLKTFDIRDVAYKVKSVDYDDTEELQLKALYKAIHKLNDIDKALIFLYLEDKPYKEISATLGISDVNARVKMNRAKEKLKNILNP